MAGTKLRALWPLILIGLLAAIPLRAILFGGETPGPWDQIATMVPGGPEAKDLPAWQVLQADGALQFYGWRKQVLEAYSAGGVPVWNPHSLGGIPLAANSQSGASYPPHVLLGVAGVPVGVALALLAWFHLVVAGLGVAALARQVGATPLGASLGGGLFAVSPFMVGWVALPSVISTVAWVPWLVAAVLLATRRGRAVHLVGAGLAGSMMLLAGHLQFAALGLLAGLVAFVAGWVVFRPRFTVRDVSVALVGLGLCAVGTLVLIRPVLDYSQLSHRRNTPTAEGYRAYLGGAMSPSEAVGLVESRLFGDPTARVKVSETLEAPAFWPTLRRPAATYPETAIGIGAIGLVLAFLGRWNRRLIPVAAVGILGVLVAFGTPLNQALYFGVPGWSSTGIPARAGFLIALCLAVLAARGIGRARFSPIALGVGGAAIVGSLVLANAQDVTGMAMVGAFPALLAALLAGVLVVGGARATLPPGWRPGTLAVPMVFLAALLVPAPPSGKVPDLSGLPRPASGQRVAVEMGDWNLYDTPKALLPPNLLSIAGVSEVSGYDSLISRDRVEWFKAIAGGEPAPPENGNMMRIREITNLEPLIDAGVELIYARRLIPGAEPISTIGAVTIHRIPGAPIVQGDRGSVRFRRLPGGGIEFDPDGSESYLVREQFSPNWSALQQNRRVQVEKEGPWIRVKPSGDQQPIRLDPDPSAKTRLFWGFLAVFLAVLVEGLIKLESVRRQRTFMKS